MNRREWLVRVVAASVVGESLRGWAQDRPSAAARIGPLIGEYGDQGHHRTGTDVDRRSGEWLARQVRTAGLVPELEPFDLRRVDPGACHLRIEDRTLDGLPFFDGAFTDETGVSGSLGLLAGDAEIGLVEAAPNSAGTGALGEARRAGRHRAIICVTQGGRPGLCPHNADDFLMPFGPPVLQVSSDEWGFLRTHAERRTPVTLVAAAARTQTTAFNVVTRIDGADSALPPLVIMTPRSGWYSCASERGGGIACWLELMRMLQTPAPPRGIWFVASSGHELGHLGIDAFIARRPSLVRGSVAWMHLGANIGAAVAPPASRGSTVQASDEDLEARLAGAMEASRLAIGRRTPRGTVPGGEAEAVHHGGGRYVSVIGANAWFHNPADRGPGVVDVEAIARHAGAFFTVATGLLSAR